MGEIYLETTKAEEAIKKTKEKTKNLTSTLDNVGKSAKNLGNNLSLYLTGPLAALGGFAIKSGMEYEASLQQVNRTLAESSDRIIDFANNNALAFNMSKNAAIKYGAVYSNLLSSFIKDTDETAKQTEKLLTASAVISSATGRTIEDVMDRIRSGLLGNTEAIEDLGVNVNVAMLESTDAFKRFAGDKSWDQLDFATQQQIRLFGILEQTTKKYGDEVANNTSSKTQQLTANFENLKTQIGTQLLPIFNNLIDKATQIVNWFANLDSGTQENIVNFGLFVAAIGPVALAIAGLTRIIKGAIDTVIVLKVVFNALTTSQVLANIFNLKNMIGGVTTAVNFLKTSLMALGSNPVVLAIGAIILTVTILITKLLELKNALNMKKEADQKLNDSRKKYNEYLTEVASKAGMGANEYAKKNNLAGLYPGFAKGLDYVPYDNFPALLHKGERVLTAKENNNYSTAQTINNNIIIDKLQVRDDKDIERIAEELYYLQKRSVA